MDFFSDHNSKWIGRKGKSIWKDDQAVLPAPYFRKVFQCANPAGMKIAFCGLGYYELFINGRKVSENVLDPIVTQYDKRVRYVIHDVSDYLKKGENVIGVILGNGWYNCHTPEVWKFYNAAWRDYPKLLLEIRSENEELLFSDTSWKVSEGPIIFDGLRNGEHYDARLELGDWLSCTYNDSTWGYAAIVSPPGGGLEEQTAVPCRITQTIEMKKINIFDVYDTGVNITGHARITVRGKAGSQVTLRYAERLTDDGELSTYNQDKFIKGGDFQTDKYILKGDGIEVWEPRFTYHGFQYVHVIAAGDVEIIKLEARLVNSGFKSVGQFTCSSEMLNRLQDCTRRSYLSNFTGIPTDCPHREKNAWTGDAQLAVETGLFNFDGVSSYKQWIDSFRDAQRPSGQLPAIIPNAGWNYTAGPAWDSALFVIPYNIYLFTGDKECIVKNYDLMRSYLDFCAMMSENYTVDFGLGDWCPPDWDKMAPAGLTSTGCYYGCVIMFSKFAGLLGREDDRHIYAELALEIKAAFNKKYYHGDGVYANGEMTSIGAALYWGLCDDSEKTAAVLKLASLVNTNDCKADFGILGAKYIPRVLADNGHADLAFRIITQEEYPGWGYWMKKGATTLWEHWKGNSSKNHIMFGDISAWMFKYPGGFSHNFDIPGEKYLKIAPMFIVGLEHVKAEHQGYVSEWQADGGVYTLSVTVPDGAAASVYLPDGTLHEVTGGSYQFESDQTIKTT
ncbi:MAG: family 78 glycoside hydrolase catalytic domain [Lentisphaerota bacterium]